MSDVVDHYKTLGVARDASGAEIRAAFRRKASEHHPDKGGGAADMARVNAAYETLSDEQRRKHYDETGRDSIHSAAERGAAIARDAFARALCERQPNPVATAAHIIVAQRSKLDAAQKKLAADVEFLAGVVTGVKRKDKKDNVMRHVAESMLDDATRQLKNSVAELKALDHAKSELEAYTFKSAPTKSAEPGVWVTTSFTSATAGTGTRPW